MPQIDVDFEVWKVLTARRHSESHTYNDVIRDLLDLGKPIQDIGAGLVGLPNVLQRLGGGFESRGMFLPNGTQLRASYKGQSHTASIQDGSWVDEAGKSFSSPSAAASSITGTQVNGLRFWRAKRPSDTEWRLLESFQGQKS